MMITKWKDLKDVVKSKFGVERVKKARTHNIWLFGLYTVRSLMTTIPLDFFMLYI